MFSLLHYIQMRNGPVEVTNDKPRTSLPSNWRGCYKLLTNNCPHTLVPSWQSYIIRKLPKGDKITCLGYRLHLFHLTEASREVSKIKSLNTNISPLTTVSIDMLDDILLSLDKTCSLTINTHNSVTNLELMIDIRLHNPIPCR
ncbi:hypothetical protein D3C87_1374630 [compost metagenome]